MGAFCRAKGKYDEISAVLHGLVIRLSDRHAENDRVLITEFIDVGELGLALEPLADARSEDEKPLTAAERSKGLSVVERMKMGTRSCPSGDLLPRSLAARTSAICLCVGQPGASGT